MTPNFARDFASPDGGNFDCKSTLGLVRLSLTTCIDPVAQQKLYENNPEVYLKFRKALEKAMTGSFALVRAVRLVFLVILMNALCRI